MQLKDIAEMVHALAHEKGWYDENPSEDIFINQACNNLHGEVTELHDAWRNGKLHESCDKAELMSKHGLPVLTCAEEELADIIIRACDDAVRLNVDIEYAVLSKHAYNQTRLHRHGGKKC